jgi:hypothetical protein
MAPQAQETLCGMVPVNGICDFYIKVRGVHTVVLVINTGNNCSDKTQLISLLDYVLSNNSNTINTNTITIIR